MTASRTATNMRIIMVLWMPVKQTQTKMDFRTAPQGFNTDLYVFVPDADPTTTTDPLDEDSDDDGQLDGEEDANHNGRVDAGETNPNQVEKRAIPSIPLLLLDD